MEKTKSKVIVTVEMTGQNRLNSMSTSKIFFSILSDMASRFDASVLQKYQYGATVEFDEGKCVDAVNFGWIVPYIFWQMGGHDYRIAVGIAVGDAMWAEPSGFNFITGDAAKNSDGAMLASKGFGIEDTYASKNCVIDKSVKAELENAGIDLSRAISSGADQGTYVVNELILSKDCLNRDIVEKVIKSNRYNSLGCLTVKKTENFEAAIVFFKKGLTALSDDDCESFFSAIKSCVGENVNSIDLVTCLIIRNMGFAYSKAKKDDIAINTLEKVREILEAIPFSSALHLKRLGGAYERSKQYQLALDTFNEALTRYLSGNHEIPEIEESIKFCKLMIELS